MESLMLENLQTKDAIKQVFGLDLSCSPSYPNQMCQECVQSLEYSFIFHQQLVNAEKLFQALQERGLLSQSLTEAKRAGESIPSPEELLDASDPLSDSQQNSTVTEYLETEELPKSTDGEESTMEEEDEQWPEKTAEKVIEIKIEAIEELEIISNPLECNPTQQRTANSSDDVENCIPLGLRAFNGEHGADRASTAEQKVNRAIVPNKCYVCYKIYGNEAELMAHLIEHNDLLPFRCQQCSTPDRVFEYRTTHALNKHLETHLYPFDCTECRLRFRKITTRNDHFLRMHMSEGLYTCERCGLEFRESRKFRLHMAAHRNMELQRYKCTVCAKAFQSSTLLERHKLVHAQKPLFLCQHCMRGFNSKSNYMQHKMQHLQRESLIHCGESGCRQNFTNVRDWRRHMKMHYPEEPLYWEGKDLLPGELHDAASYPKACPEADCSYVAASLPLMFAHYRVHYKAFQCQQCEGKFSNASALRVHVEVRHEGVRRFECDQCGKRFAYRHKLREHMNGHLGVRSFKCKHCPRTFTCSSNLAVHRRTHAVEQAMSSRRCAICETTFVSPAALACHHQEYLKSDHTGVSACERIRKRKLTEGVLVRSELDSSTD